ncbi:uncharacterized protein zgc:109986 isoform X2 [Nothobranchius furzeri]|uniref:Transcript variant X3 n=1 Tax=Nothobranchius furzeri TaxID=105023 RepID=A0A1A8A186_NOTFU|nr:uncharacterized protein zgc:109986 isoform X2 [Nothobranchius furzeri]KAF7201223.1 transcript variant X3 [Nothobranchius furzeri]
MDFSEAKLKLQQLLNNVTPSELPKLLEWMRNSGELDQPLFDNNKAMLRSIADDLKAMLPVDAMLPSETTAHLKMQQRARPTVHVDSFLYSDEQVDSLCEEGTMSRNYCLSCGSIRTAPLDFISHSFSASELQFLFQNVLPDLTGRTLVDVGSRLGAVLYGVLHADVCTQDVLLQSADVLVMNNVFEYFMESSEQVRSWKFIMQNFRRPGSLLVSVPSLQESLNALQMPFQPGWVEEIPLVYDIYLGRDADPDAIKQIHLYRVT